MSGDFSVEDKTGSIIFATSPGMESVTSKNGDVKKNSNSTKRLTKKTIIQIFLDLIEGETDPKWDIRFQKMSESRFPGKITWVSSTDDDLYGELIYKNRQSIKPLKIYKKDNLETIRDYIKSFITNYTNIDNEDEEFNDTVQVIDKTSIIPQNWNKLSAKDQSSLITEYVKTFSLENDLTKDESKSLLTFLILYAMGKNILPYLTFDSNGNIEKIKGLYKDKDSNYKLKLVSL